MLLLGGNEDWDDVHPVRTLVCRLLVLPLWLTATLAWAQPGGESRGRADAQALADRHPGAEVLRVEGDSMRPFFDSGALLVAKPIDLAALRPGMIVVYENDERKRVVHQVIRAVSGGWEVRGANNVRADRSLVTSGNLRGVVYGVFHALGSSAGALADDLPVAFAAAAR